MLHLNHNLGDCWFSVWFKFRVDLWSEITDTRLFLKKTEHATVSVALRTLQILQKLPSNPKLY